MIDEWKGDLRIHFFDVFGERLRDDVDVHLRHNQLPHRAEVFGHRGTKSIKVEGLRATHGRTYRIRAYPVHYRPVSRYVVVREGQENRENLVFPVDPDRVLTIEDPEYDDLSLALKNILEASDLESNPGKKGNELYSALDDIRKAGLLNLSAKMAATSFDDGSNVFSFLDSLTRLRGDRLFANVQKELRDETINSIDYRLFHEVTGSLHTPPSGLWSLWKKRWCRYQGCRNSWSNPTWRNCW